jgi:hypothetical protein
MSQSGESDLEKAILEKVIHCRIMNRQIAILIIIITGILGTMSAFAQRRHTRN